MAQSTASTLKKAWLYEVKWQPKNPAPQKVNGGNDVEVQFNPQTLKLTYSNENKSGGQPKGSASQFVGAGSSKLSVELLFDTSAGGTDVRYWSRKVGYFMKPSGPPTQKNRVPPGVSLEWGTFSFPGVVDSLQETLDYFSEDGVPLRATITLGITRLDIVFPQEAPEPKKAAAAGKPGTAPRNATRAGDTVAKAAGRNGNSSDWKSVAAANDIDDPLHIPAGTMLDLDPGASAGIGGGIGIGAGAGGGLGIGAGAGAELGFSAGLGGGAGFAAGASAGIGGGIGAGIGGGISAGIGGGIGGGVGASAGASFGASAGASAGIGASAGGGAIARAGGSFGARASAGGSLGVGGSAKAGGSIGAGF